MGPTRLPKGEVTPQEAEIMKAKVLDKYLNI